MTICHKIKEIVVLDPLSPNLEVVLDGIEADFAERIKRYIADRSATRFGFEHKDEEYRFYNLDKHEVIHLRHLPKPEANNAGPRYYTIAEFLRVIRSLR